MKAGISFFDKSMIFRYFSHSLHPHAQSRMLRILSAVHAAKIAYVGGGYDFTNRTRGTVICPYVPVRRSDNCPSGNV